VKFRSTRRGAPPLAFSQALSQSLAPDGGLYVPETFPLAAWDKLKGDDLPAAARACLAPFFAGDPLEKELAAIVEEAFAFPAPLLPAGAGTKVLELFHGPTAAFKDFGARFLAACLTRLGGGRTVLVATSGDTGGAVAAAFHGRPNFRVVIVYPKGRVSPRQEKQLAAWGANVRALSVRGSFDDCQRLVKEAFADAALAKRCGLVAANSISVGRLLPQMSYYAAASLAHYRRSGKRAGFVVPTGNLGNAVAGFWARELGFPIDEIALATNANRAVSDYLESGARAARPTIPTIANAMDVGLPSNLERLIDLCPELERLRQTTRALSVSDEQIQDEIRRGFKELGRAWCPHSAAAAFMRRSLPGQDWIVVATAHPAKFETVVEPLIGKTLDVPPALADILKRPSLAVEIGPDLPELVRELDA